MINQSTRSMNVMRSVMKKYEGQGLNDLDLIRVWSEIRNALRLKALPIDGEYIDRFVRNYGSEEFPKEGPGICLFCNHMTYVEIESMTGFPTGVRTCAPCYVKLEGPKSLTR